LRAQVQTGQPLADGKSKLAQVMIHSVFLLMIRERAARLSRIAGLTGNSKLGDVLADARTCAERMRGGARKTGHVVGDGGG
jgi:hypothetical protein